MKIAQVTIESNAPYSSSKHIDDHEHPKKPKESPDDYEQRTWRYRLHVSADGRVEIPGACFANSIKSAAKRLQLPVPGKRMMQFTKLFEAGVMIPDPLKLAVKADDVLAERLFVPSDGRPGGGKRVFRHFPRVDVWGGTLTVYILDDTITEHVFTQVVRSAGLLVGVGRFRPENRGYYGRFSVKAVKWIDDGDAFLAAGAS